MKNINELNFKYFKLLLKWLNNNFIIFFIYDNYWLKLINKKNLNNESKILKLNCINYKLFKNKYNLIFNSYYNYFIDYIFIYWLSFLFLLKNFSNFNFIFYFKIQQKDLLNFGIYKIFKQNMFFFYFSLFSGFKYFWNLIRFWFLGLLFSLFILYYFVYVRLLSFGKIVFEWFLISMFIYWLLSGFVFFIKKYQYSKFTSVIQRFWKRSFILFWIIEGYLFIFFFFITLNSSEEPIYMYDQIRMYKTHFFSWRFFFLKIMPIIIMIFLTYYLQLSIKWSLFNKQSIIILIITLLMLYTLWLEFYQFFHLVNFYGNLNWIFDYDEFLWNLELEFRRTRLVNNYVSLCLLAKFWHLIFIFIFWVFFILRINELNRIRYPLLSANYQNLILLYILSWLYMYSWFKYFLRNLLDTPYYWLMLNNRSFVVRIFFSDLKLFLFNFLDFFKIYYFYFTQLSFYYWYESSNLLGFNQFKKHALKDLLINYFNN